MIRVRDVGYSFFKIQVKRNSPHLLALDLRFIVYQGLWGGIILIKKIKNMYILSQQLGGSEALLGGFSEYLYCYKTRGPILEVGYL